MVDLDLDLERAKNLLESAKDLYERGDMAGVAGLAYAAFESAIIALTKKKNGKDYPSHLLRRERAKVLLEEYQDKVDVLWEARNIDFYGNVKIGDEIRELSRDEVEDGLSAVEKIIEEVEKVLSFEG
ncbi:MAG: HEPN domain-containing protein [Methanophagales archaeon]|nr:HEPN domain-containing protein [Methanophagales archaeon]